MQIETTPEYLASQNLSPDFLERFWSKVNKTESCWIFTGHIMERGHGQMNRGGGTHKLILVHRASWIIHRGPIPDGLCVCHDCPHGDNPSCVNPDHLWLGTKGENTLDMWAKGRNKPRSDARGELNPAAKLTKEIVIAIRESYATGNTNIPKLSKLYRVSRSSIHRAITRLTWSHIK